jgi:hypothetical protein
MLASIKPNFIIPLIIVMLLRKNFRAVGIGLLLSVAAAAIGIGWLAYHNGLGQVIEDIRTGQNALHEDATEMPVNTWTRTDILAMIAKFTNWVPGDTVYLGFMLLFLAALGYSIQRASQFESNRGANGLSATIGLLAILLGLYHQSYDCLLLAVPVVGLLFFGKQTMPEASPMVRIAAALLMAVPAINFLSTMSAMDYLELERLSIGWQAITLINTIALSAALILLLTVGSGKAPAAQRVT